MVLMRSILIICLIGLAGCADVSTFETDDAPGTPGDGPVTPAEPQTPVDPKRPHGDVERTESAVTTRPDGTRYVASKTVTLSNGAAGASAMDFSADFSSGFLRMTPGHDGYTYELIVEVRADTEQAAKEAMKQVTVDHQDTLKSGKLSTATAISLGQVTPLVIGTGVNIRTEFVALVPTLPTDVDVDVATADLRFDGIQGTRLDLTTSTGDISGAVDFDEALIAVTTGDVNLEGTLRKATTTGSTGEFRFDGRLDALTLERSTGDVNLDVTPGASGTYTLSTSTGEVQIDILGGGDRGQDVEARTSTGDLNTDLVDEEAVGEQSEDHIHVRTKGYADKGIRTGITITTSTGDVDVDN